MPKKPKRAPGKVRRQLVIPVELDDKLRDVAHKNREWPSVTGGRALAKGLDLDPSTVGIEPSKAAS